MSLTTMQPSSPSQNVLFPPSTTSFPGKETGIRCTFPFPVRSLHLQRRQKWPFDEGRGGTTTGGGARAVLIIGKGGKEAAGGRKKGVRCCVIYGSRAESSTVKAKERLPGEIPEEEKRTAKKAAAHRLCVHAEHNSATSHRSPFAIPLYDCGEKISYTISASLFSFSATKKSSNRET